MNTVRRNLPSILNAAATILLLAAGYEALRFNAWSAICDLFLSHMLINESKFIVIRRKLEENTTQL